MGYLGYKELTNDEINYIMHLYRENPIIKKELERLFRENEKFHEIAGGCPIRHINEYNMRMFVAYHGDCYPYIINMLRRLS